MEVEEFRAFIKIGTKSGASTSYIMPSLLSEHMQLTLITQHVEMRFTTHYSPVVRGESETIR